MRKLTLVAALLACGCTRSEAPEQAPAPSASAPQSEPPEHDAPHYGEVMSEIGRRFELTGRAASAGRFRLAEYEVAELGEALEDDLPRAEPPREGDPKKLEALLKELEAERLPALSSAAKAQDAETYVAAFAATAKTCNACHQATGHEFVEIPERPGASVPRLDAVGADAGSVPRRTNKL